MSITTTHGRSTNTRRKQTHRRSRSIFKHTCSICHEVYTNSRKEGDCCEKKACRRIYKLEKQRDAAAALNQSSNV